MQHVVIIAIFIACAILDTPNILPRQSQYKWNTHKKDKMHLPVSVIICVTQIQDFGVNLWNISLVEINCVWNLVTLVAAVN